MHEGLADMLTVSFVGKKFTCNVQLEVSTTTDNDGGLKLVLQVNEKVPGPSLASLNVSIGGRNEMMKCKEILTFLKDQALPKTLKFISVNMRTREQKREQQSEGLRLLNCIWPGKSRARHEVVRGESNMCSVIKAATETNDIFHTMVDAKDAGRALSKETPLNIKESHMVYDSEEEQVSPSYSEVLTQIDTGEAIFGTTKLRSWNVEDMFQGSRAQCCSTRAVNTYAHNDAKSSKIILSQNVKYRDSCRKETADKSVKESSYTSHKAETFSEQSTARMLSEPFVRHKVIENASNSAMKTPHIISPAKKDDCNGDASLAKEVVAKVVIRATTKYMNDVLQEKSIHVTKKMGTPEVTVPDVACFAESAQIVLEEEQQASNKTQFLKCEDIVVEHCQMVKESRRRDFNERGMQQRDINSNLSCQDCDQACFRMLEEYSFQEYLRPFVNLSESCYGVEEDAEEHLVSCAGNTQVQYCKMRGTLTPRIYGDAVQLDEHSLLHEVLSKSVTQDCDLEETAYDGISLTDRTTQEELNSTNPSRRHFVKLYDVSSHKRAGKRATSRYLSCSAVASVSASPALKMAIVSNPVDSLRFGRCLSRGVNSHFMQMKDDLMRSVARGSTSTNRSTNSSDVNSQYMTDSPDIHGDDVEMRSETEADEDSTDPSSEQCDKIHARNSSIFYEDGIIPEMGTSFADSSILQGLTGDRRSPLFRRTLSESHEMPERKRWLPGQLCDPSLSSEFELVNLSSKRRSASCPVVSEEDIILESLESHHQDVCKTLARRTWVIINVKELWNAGKPLDAIKLCITLTGMGEFDGRLGANSENKGAGPIKNDHVLFLNILQQLPSSCTLWNLDMCLLLLPKLRGFISTGHHTSHVEMTCAILHVVIKKVHIVIRRVQKAARSPTRDIVQMIRDATSELREIKEKTRNTVQALDKCDVTHRIEDIATLKPVLRELHVALETFLHSCTV